MGGNTGYTNFQAKEASVNGEITLTFNLRNRLYTIFNDSSTDNLRFKFKPSQDEGTILPLQNAELPVVTKTVILESVGDTNVSYRVWGQG